MNVDERIADLCRTYLDVKLSDTATHRIRSSIDAELEWAGVPQPKPIMTIEDVAAYLRVSVTEVEAYLGDIPCFEFSGKLRFRTQAVEVWIEQRERAFTSDIIRFGAKEERKFSIV